VEIYLHAFLPSAPEGGEWSASRPGRCSPGTHWTGGCVGPRTGLDAVAKRKIGTVLSATAFRPVPVSIELFSLGQRGQSVKLTTHLHTVPRLMNGESGTFTFTDGSCCGA